jgi:Zn-dependent M28 family amino/carboxypeptidase
VSLAFEVMWHRFGGRWVARHGPSLLLKLVVVLALPSVPEAATLPPVATEVSAEEIARTLEALNHDRTSGRDGERRGAITLEEKLRAYGVKHTRHEVRAYLSWPGRASLEAVAPEAFALKATTFSFAAKTPSTGVRGEAVLLPRTTEDDQTPLESSVRGRIVVAQGLVSPESAWRAQQAGAIGLVHVNDVDVLHEMTTTTIWGTPTTESARRLPAIPIVSITRTDGERLAALAKRGPLTLRVEAEVEQGWTTIPLVVAEIAGRRPEFALVATHLDAWYEGMTDTAGTVATVLEMARVLQKRQGELERGVRFAWWPGHSFGRYAGSTWFADRFWTELDERCFAYTNLDGSGRRGSQMDQVYAGSWPGIAEWSREVARRVAGREPVSPPEGLFRPGRDSDSAFQGLGIPEFAIGVPGPPAGHPDVEPSGLIVYWHTAQDTLDKLDQGALLLDTQYRVAQLHELVTRPVLPLRLGPIVNSYAAALAELREAAASTFDLVSTQKAVSDLAVRAVAFDQAPVPTTPAERRERDRVLVRLTHRLNATLYTRAGRFDQDPAVSLAILPLLARARELPSHPRDSDSFGFLETELGRGRNAVESTLRDATHELERYLRAETRP